MGFESVAVMQPYLFPYLGYFHLIAAARNFVFYDDVNFIKQGWINRNNILLGEKPYRFSVPVSDGSSFQLIKNVRMTGIQRWFDKFEKTLFQAYGKAPHCQEVSRMVSKVFTATHASIADLAIASIEQTHAYLDLPFSSIRSSERFPHTQGMEKADRLIQITREFGLNAYVNAPGGKDLYSKSYFAQQGICLSFVKSESITYSQSTPLFVPNLSMIDVLMFNDKASVRSLLSRFTLE